MALLTDQAPVSSAQANALHNGEKSSDQMGIEISQNARISDIHLSNAPSTLLNSLFGQPRSTSHVGDLLDVSTYAYQNGTR